MFLLLKKRGISIFLGSVLLIGLSLGTYTFAVHPGMTKWVKQKLVVNKIETDKKIIALTFDDGPDPVNTPELLDILQKHKVKATFFLMGSRAEKYQKLVQRIALEGHEIGNHSFSHPDFNDKSDDFIVNEIKKTDIIIYQLTGQKPHLFRPPGGYLSYALVDFTKENEITIVYWTYQQDSKDWQTGRNASKIAQHIKDHLQPGQIIVLHDGCPNGLETAKAMDILIPALHKEGYDFVTMSDLIKSGNKE